MKEVAISEVLAAFPKRGADSHKGDYGHVLVIAGSFGYTGAAYLASQSAIRSGSGLVTLAVGKSLYPIMAAKLDEVMVRPFFETRDASLSLLAEKELVAFAERTSSIAIGPGISQNRETQSLVRNLVAKIAKPMVLDADGLNALAGHTEALKNAKGKLVLTPHAGEMARLVNKTAEDIQSARKEVALAFATEYNTVLILKGHRTVVAAPGGEFYINTTGNAGMATAGAGDLLTGIVASFIGQGLDTFSAAAAGAYFHGLAGDIAVKEKGLLGLIASDILEKLPEALKVLS